MKTVLLFFFILLSQEIMSQGAEDKFLSCYSKDDFRGNWPQYYQTGAGYEGGLYAIKEHFKKAHISTGNQRDTGYFTVRFIINCVGEIGNFEQLQCSFDFKPITFSEELHKQIISALKDLKSWQAGVDGGGTKIDSQKFLTFVMNHGQIKDIVPK